MPAIVNPFDAGGYSLAEMTEAINVLPNVYSRVTDLGLFRPEPITTPTVLIEYANGTMNLLPSAPRGAPASVAKRDRGQLRSLVVPHIPYDDDILAQDLIGIREGFGRTVPDQLADVMNRRLTRMRAKHDLTREYMLVNALQGILKDGAGATLYNFYTEFGVSQITVDFDLGTTTTDVVGKARTVLDNMDDNLSGEVMTGAHALVDRTFFNKMVSHPKVVDAYKFFASSGTNPLRDDVRRVFPFGGIDWEVYSGTATLSDGTTTSAFLPASGGVAFPLGTIDNYVIYDAPAEFIETVGTPGVPFYARQYTRADGKGVQIQTESDPFPIVKRPRLSIKVTSST